jgi:hypothetical protein
MPALGYIPGDKFAFPRSYIYGIEIRHDPPAPIWSTNHVEFIIAGFPDALCKVDFAPEFSPWSSNRYTLDFLVTNATYEYPPNPAVFNLPYYIVYRVVPEVGRGCVQIDVTYGALYTVHALQAAPSGYWLAPPLGT